MAGFLVCIVWLTDEPETLKAMSRGRDVKTETSLHALPDNSILLEWLATEKSYVAYKKNSQKNAPPTTKSELEIHLSIIFSRL